MFCDRRAKNAAFFALLVNLWETMIYGESCFPDILKTAILPRKMSHFAAQNASFYLAM